MRALLLAAGLGTRLRPLTNTVPKCLVDIGGRPLLDFWMQMLSAAGINEILINMHHLSDEVQKYIDRCQYPVDINTVYENDLLGTAGTVLANADYFKGEPVILIHADNLSIFNFHDFIEKFNSRDENIEITMMIFEADDPRLCGVVELDDHGIVMGFHEKVSSPPSNLANGAVYILSPMVIQFIESLNKQIVDFSTEVIPCFLGRINTYKNTIYHRDIGSVKSYEQAKIDFKGDKNFKIMTQSK